MPPSDAVVVSVVVPVWNPWLPCTPQIEVRHERASGWAGRPRNVGINIARGRWIRFVDQDDMLTPSALRRPTELEDSCAADIVLGKVTSGWRPVDQDVFRPDRTDANLSNAPLIKSLTPPLRRVRVGGSCVAQW